MPWGPGTLGVHTWGHGVGPVAGRSSRAHRPRRCRRASRRATTRRPSRQPGDAADLYALYRRLSDDDRWLRFFTVRSTRPVVPRAPGWRSRTTEGLVVVGSSRTGRSAHPRRRSRVLAARDGDGELGITVDPQWRGWIGPGCSGAAPRGRRAGCAQPAGRRPGDEPTDARAPAVPPHGRRRALPAQRDPAGSSARPAVRRAGRAGHDKPRILVEAAYGRWDGEDAARTAGFEVRTCRGPRTRAIARCSPAGLSARRRCRRDRDAVPLDAPYTEPLVAAPSARTSSSSCRPTVRRGPGTGDEPSNDPTEVVARIRRLLGLAET